MGDELPFAATHVDDDDVDVFRALVRLDGDAFAVLRPARKLRDARKGGDETARAAVDVRDVELRARLGRRFALRIVGERDLLSVRRPRGIPRGWQMALERARIRAVGVDDDDVVAVCLLRVERDLLSVWREARPAHFVPAWRGVDRAALRAVGADGLDLHRRALAVPRREHEHAA